jgi:hypothetical protein
MKKKELTIKVTEEELSSWKQSETTTGLIPMDILN